VPGTEATPPPGRLDRGFRSTIRGESTAFGFSIMITVTFGVVQREHGSPGIGDLLLYALGAVLAFTLLEGLASRAFRASLPEHPSGVTTLGTAMNFASVGLAVGAAIGLSALVATDVAWPLCPFAAVLVYLLAETVELAVAERVRQAMGDDPTARMSD
jgi:hypothetical protein